MTFTADQVTIALDALEWSLPGEFLHNTPQQPVLFRGHDNLNAFTTGHYGSAGSIVHATPFLKIAASPWKFKLARNFENFPGKCAFVSVFSCDKNQVFYPDETLELAKQNNAEAQCRGTPLGEIESFDDKDHFETDVTSQNKYLATYLYKHDGLGNNLLLARLEHGSAIWQMLDANAKKAKTLPLHKPGLT